jgi:hypothetical protein
MDITTVGQAGGAATVGAVLIKVIDKIPWGKLIGRNGNGKEPISKEAVMVLIGDHHTVCTARILNEMKDVKNSLSTEMKDVRDTIVQMLLQDRNK